MDKLNFKEMKNLLMDEPWSNAACIGYVIMACEELNIEKSDTTKMINQLNSIFDRYSIEDAKDRYINY